jgi:alpha-beta hydrolase superfamily lysophospholipase
LQKHAYKDTLLPVFKFSMEKSMNPKQFILQTIKGENIFAFEWKPENKIDAVIANVHGLGEHSGRYEHVADFYGQHNIAFIAFDLFGHGKSGGKRGYLPEKNMYLSSINHLLQYAADQFPNIPLFLRGHSLGGELVLWYALERKPHIQGIISTSPFFASYDPLPPIKLNLARIMNVILPSFSMENGLDTDLLSKDEGIVSEYVQDPLVHKMVSARLGWTMVEQGSWLLDHAEEFPLPLLLVIGSNERIVDRAKIEEFARLAPQVDLKIWQNLFHETHNEPEKELVLRYELKWVKDHLK